MALYDVTALDSALEFDTTLARSISIVAVPGEDKVVIGWVQSTTIVYVQAFSVNPSTGAISAIGSPVDIETGTLASTFNRVALCMIDASNLIAVWTGQADDGFAQLLSLDGTGNVSTNGSAHEWETAKGSFPSACLMDSTHVLIAYGDTDDDTRARILTVNTGTGSITSATTQVELIASTHEMCTLIKLSSTKALCFFGAGNAYRAVVLDINTSTWAVSLAGSVVTIDSVGAICLSPSALLLSDGSPMVVALMWEDTTADDVFLQTFDINTSTWAITAKGTAINPDVSVGSSGAYEERQLALVDATHLIAFYRGDTSANGYTRVYTYDSSTGDFTATANELEFESASSCYYQTTCKLDSGLFITAWSGTGSDGFVQSFNVSTGYEITALTGSYTYTGVNANTLKGFKILSDVGSYTYTGIASNLLKGFKLAADVGSYILTGINNAFSRTYILLADLGTYTYTGVNANLNKGFSMLADAGSYVLTGIDSAFSRTYKLAADVGAYVLTGIDSTLTRGYVIMAEVGSYVLTGVNANLLAAFKLVASVGSYALTGVSANLLKGFKLVADLGTYTLTGIAATFTRGYNLIASVGSYVLTGVRAFLRPSDIWDSGTKSSSTWTDSNKSASPTWTENNKNSSNWTETPRS